MTVSFVVREALACTVYEAYCAWRRYDSQGEHPRAAKTWREAGYDAQHYWRSAVDRFVDSGSVAPTEDEHNYDLTSLKIKHLDAILSAALGMYSEPTPEWAKRATL